MRVLALLLVLLAAAPLEASPRRDETAALYNLSLWVARVSVNEGAFKRRSQAALVWQTTRENGKNTEKRASWLSRHSPRVHGSRVCHGGNCLWSPNLTREATLPAGLLLDPIKWELDVMPLWLDTLRYVDWMVLGDRRSEDPCPIPPRTWGCEQDRPRAIAKGLYPIGCMALDDGFTWEKNCWRGGGWICDPRFEPAVQSENEVESYAVLR